MVKKREQQEMPMRRAYDRDGTKSVAVLLATALVAVLGFMGVQLWGLASRVSSMEAIIALLVKKL